MIKNLLLYSFSILSLFLASQALRADDGDDDTGQDASLKLDDGASDSLLWRYAGPSGLWVYPADIDYCNQDPVPLDCLVGGRYYYWWNWYRGTGYYRGHHHGHHRVHHHGHHHRHHRGHSGGHHHRVR